MRPRPIQPILCLFASIISRFSLRRSLGIGKLQRISRKRARRAATQIDDRHLLLAPHRREGQVHGGMFESKGRLG